MARSIIFLIYFICGMAFSQNLEEAIYTAAETLISKNNGASFNLLNAQEANFKSLVKTKDEQLALVFLQCHKAYYLETHSKLKEAIATYEEALKRFNDNALSKLSDFDIIESCFKPLGNLYTKTGDYTNAVSTINQYLYLAEKNKNTKHQISGAINLAKLYQTISKHETVLKIVNDALKLSNASTNQKALLQGIKTSSLIALNNYEDASLLNNAASQFQRFKNDYFVAFQKGNYEKALVSFEKAKEHLDSAEFSSRDLAKFYVEEAQLQFLLKNKNGALKSLQKAINLLIPNFKSEGLPSEKNLYAENTFVDIFDLHAAIETDAAQALKSYDLSFYVSGLLQDNWTSQEAKILNETNNRIRSENCIELLLTTYKQTKNKTLLFEAFQYAETHKASVLKSVHLKKKQLQKHPTDTLLIQELHLIKEQERYTNLLIKEQLGTNKASKVNALSAQLSHISIQLKALKTAIEKKYPQNKTLYSLKAIQQKLAKNQAVLIAYFYGRKAIYQFVISETNISIETIPLTNETKESIIDFIHLFDNASIINNAINQYTTRAFGVYNLLKFNQTASYRNVVIIPDGLLNFVPFEALLSSKTASTVFANMPFVVKNQTVAYNSSVQFFLTESTIVNNNKLLGFFPVFEHSNQKLTYSIDEAQAIKKEMPSTIFLNAQASKGNFIKHAPNFGILHVSTHASSGNFVTPANISFFDDTMYLNELYSLDLNAHLVVLSACETGVGKLYKGEGAMSIARGFQYAGAENLLFTLWQINDLSTSQIMESFYENYADLQSAYLANNRSKIAYLKNETIGNAKKSPYYWSAFVYYGQLDAAKTNGFNFYIIFGSLLVLIVLLLVLKNRNHGRDS